MSSKLCLELKCFCKSKSSLKEKDDWWRSLDTNGALLVCREGIEDWVLLDVELVIKQLIQFTYFEFPLKVTRYSGSQNDIFFLLNSKISISFLPISGMWAITHSLVASSFFLLISDRENDVSELFEIPLLFLIMLNRVCVQVTWSQGQFVPTITDLSIWICYK